MRREVGKPIDPNVIRVTIVDEHPVVRPNVLPAIVLPKDTPTFTDEHGQERVHRSILEGLGLVFCEILKCWREAHSDEPIYPVCYVRVEPPRE